MKICPNCHRFSKDDDFCSHCGSAVFGNDDISENESISCNNYEGHSHEKQSYTQQNQSYQAEQNKAYQAEQKQTYYNQNGQKNAKHKKTSCFTTVIVIFLIIAFAVPILSEMINAFRDIF